MAEDLASIVESPKKRGRIKKLSVGILLLMTLGGGGAAAGYFAAGGIHKDKETEADLNKPQLVSKEADAIATTLAGLTGETQNPNVAETALQASYYPVKTPFTSNLKNSNHFAQISLSITTYYDERVLENIKEHETALRSAILLTLADQEMEALATHQGKENLQQLLTDAINKVLDEKTGFGGVNNVYFTSFVVQ
ncbi:MAG: flagellar basal body-associated FliL family protein [Parasphingorhabdus sp.]|uniref:flagellar basal body-associated FliL family protein n=1 Tax=Parasphingorhabdus sp. TaxID=2709688 RepID=UPI003001F7DC